MHIFIVCMCIYLSLKSYFESLRFSWRTWFVGVWNNFTWRKKRTNRIFFRQYCEPWKAPVVISRRYFYLHTTRSVVARCHCKVNQKHRRRSNGLKMHVLWEWDFGEDQRLSRIDRSSSYYASEVTAIYFVGFQYSTYGAHKYLTLKKTRVHYFLNNWSF